MEFTLTEIITALVAAANTAWIIWSSLKKNKPEIKKLENEAESEMVEAAEVNLQGAKLSGEILMARILELRADLETEKKTRREEAEYFKRRLKESEREARDYRLWAARLSKQLIEAHQIPAPFIPSASDSEVGIQAIMSRQEEKRLSEVEILKDKQQTKDEEASNK